MGFHGYLHCRIQWLTCYHTNLSHADLLLCDSCVSKITAMTTMWTLVSVGFYFEMLVITISDKRRQLLKPIHILNSARHLALMFAIMLFLQLLFGTTVVVLWCLNVSMWQHAGVTVINPFPPQACHLHNKATIPDAKASPHVYCYNYLTFKSTLMSPGWSHSLSSFGFRALLLSNKVTFHNTASPWNTHPPHKYTSTCICSAPNSKKRAWRNYKKIKL